MVSNTEELFQFALELEKGQTLREICPKCGGGTTKEKSLSITMDDSGYLLWHCFRASCGFAGRRLAWGVVQGNGSAPKKRPRGFTGELGMPPEDQSRYLWDKFGLKMPDNWRWAPEYARLYVPILGPNGHYRGAILRNTTINVAPKTLTFKEAIYEPWMHWYLQERPAAVVLVEDMFSAQKLQQSGVPAACLLGTHFGLDKVREVLSVTNSAILALDKDAYSKSLTYVVEYRHLLNLTAWKLEKDLKYEPEERIIEAYYGRKADFSRSS